MLGRDATRNKRDTTRDTTRNKRRVGTGKVYIRILQQFGMIRTVTCRVIGTLIVSSCHLLSSFAFCVMLCYVLCLMSGGIFEAFLYL